MKILKSNHFNSATIFITGILFFLFAACNERINDPDINNDGPKVTPVGEKNYFEIVTWNIRWFPDKGTKTINLVKDIIRDIDVDMIAVQEIASISAFNTLLDSLDGWQGVLSPDQYSNTLYQKTGIIYKSDLISLSSVHPIFTNDRTPFPRPPLMAYVEIKDANGVQYDFSIIVLHLKAFDGQEERDRRREAIVKLDDFISTEINNGADPDFIVIGDWNDRVSDSEATNVFLPLLDKPEQYAFLTQDLSTFIDHIMITGDSFYEFGEGDMEPLDIRKQIATYSSDVSDHLPVMARFKGFTISPSK
jgi:endonuclease/exonuclease/phosphatase family metal-dependent hydrolase